MCRVRIYRTVTNIQPGPGGHSSLFAVNAESHTNTYTIHKFKYDAGTSVYCRMVLDRAANSLCLCHFRHNRHTDSCVANSRRIVIRTRPRRSRSQPRRRVESVRVTRRAADGVCALSWRWRPDPPRAPLPAVSAHCAAPVHYALQYRIKSYSMIGEGTADGAAATSSANSTTS